MDRQTLAEVFNYQPTITALRRWWEAQSTTTRMYQHQVAGYLRLLALTYGKKRGAVYRLRMPDDKLSVPCNGFFYKVLAVKVNTDDWLNYLYDRSVTFLAKNNLKGFGPKYTEINIVNIDPVHWHSIASALAKEVDKDLNQFLREEDKNDMRLPWEDDEQ